MRRNADVSAGQRIVRLVFLAGMIIVGYVILSLFDRAAHADAGVIDHLAEAKPVASAKKVVADSGPARSIKQVAAAKTPALKTSTAKVSTAKVSTAKTSTAKTSIAKTSTAKTSMRKVAAREVASAKSATRAAVSRPSEVVRISAALPELAAAELSAVPALPALSWMDARALPALPRVQALPALPRAPAQSVPPAPVGVPAVPQPALLPAQPPLSTVPAGTGLVAATGPGGLPASDSAAAGRSQVSPIPARPGPPSRPGNQTTTGHVRDAGGGSASAMGTVPSPWRLDVVAAGFSSPADRTVRGRTVRYAGPPS